MREARRLAAQAATDTDPGAGLRAVAALRTLLDRLERRHVEQARDLGWSWQEIADALGVTRQSAHRKHTARK